MTFSELVIKIKKIKAGEARVDLSQLMECTVKKSDFEELITALDEYFGSPVKPLGVIPNGKLQVYADPYGGIRKEQIMYFIDREPDFEAVLVWPWLDGLIFTVKVICANKKEVEQMSKSPWKKIGRMFQNYVRNYGR